jgi:hypothetical protein
MTFTVKRRFFKAPGNDHWFYSFGDGLKNSVNPTVDPRDTLYVSSDESRLSTQSIWLSGPYRIWKNPLSGISLNWEREYLVDDILVLKFYFDTEQEARDFYTWYTTNLPDTGPVGSKASEIEILDTTGAIIEQNY